MKIKISNMDNDQKLIYLLDPIFYKHEKNYRLLLKAVIRTEDSCQKSLNSLHVYVYLLCSFIVCQTCIYV